MRTLVHVGSRKECYLLRQYGKEKKFLNAKLRILIKKKFLNARHVDKITDIKYRPMVGYGKHMFRDAYSHCSRIMNNILLRNHGNLFFNRIQDVVNLTNNIHGGGLRYVNRNDSAHQKGTTEQSNIFSLFDPSFVLNHFSK